MSRETPAPTRLTQLGGRAGTERFDDAERHRRRVKRLRITIPVIACLCVAAVFVSLVLNGRDDTRLVQGDAPGIEMSAPTLTGTDRNGRPFEVKAAQATQSREGLVELTDVSLRMELEDGPLTLTARTGRIQPETGLASVDGQVKINLADTHHFTTEHADADLKAGRITGNQPVRVEGPMGTIDAEGFVVEKSVQQITFTGGVRSTVNQTAPAEGSPAP